MRPGRRERSWLVPLLVALATVLVFSRSLDNGFVDWDDDVYVVDNPHVRGLGWSELRWMWTDSFRQGLYRPVALMTFGLDYTIWGLDPRGYHLTSLLLHATNALVFYFVAVRLLSLAVPRWETLLGGRALRISAGAAALLFSLHPLRVEPVAWVSARADLLAGLGGLLSVLTYLEAARGHAVVEAGRWRAASVVLLGVSLLAKPAAITLPAVLTVLDIYPLRRLGGVSTWFSPRARAVWWEKVPYWAVVMAFLPVTFLSKRAAGATLPLEEYHPGLGAAKAVFAIPFHLGKTLAPVDLSPLYQSPLPLATLLASGAMVVVTSAALFAMRAHWPAALAVWATYLLLILPASGIVSYGPQIAADRYTYLPCLGWAVLAAGGLLCLWEAELRRGIAGSPARGQRRPARGQRRPARGQRRIVALSATAAALLAMAALATLTWRHIAAWHDSESLWASAATVDPSSAAAHNNLGLTLSRRGRWDEAVVHLERALSLDPNLAWAHNNLGLARGREGRLEEAIQHYEQAIRLVPGLAQAHFNLGNALMHQGQWARAADSFGKTLELYPEFAEAQNNLGMALMAEGHIQEAMKRFEQALRIKPGYPQAQANLEIARRQLR